MFRDRTKPGLWIGILESKFKNRNTLEEGSGILVYPEPLSLFVLGPT